MSPKKMTEKQTRQIGRTFAVASALLFVLLAITSITVAAPSTAIQSAPSGATFNHVVIIAEENQYETGIFGTSATSSTCQSTIAPFLCSLLPLSSTVLNYHSYCNHGDTDPACPTNPASSSPGTTGSCSAACYTAVASGNTYGIIDCSCINSLNQQTIFSQLATAGQTWKAICEAGCHQRQGDHFPPLQFASTQTLCANTTTENCIQYTGTGCSPTNYCPESTTDYSNLITEASNPSPASLIWFTPTDCNNMHGDAPCTNSCTSYNTANACVTAGDNYLKNLLVGSGTAANPAAGSLLATSLFATGHTLLLLWWDEEGLAPNLEYGPMIRQEYVSTSNSYDEYTTLRTIENNWNLPCLALACNAPAMSDLFTSQPSNPNSNPSNGSCLLCVFTNLLPTVSILFTAGVAIGALGTILLLAKYRIYNHRLSARVKVAKDNQLRSSLRYRTSVISRKDSASA